MKTVLVLEDEPIIMELLRRMLTPYTVIEANTAEQALRLFIDHGRQVDLLVADVTLPTSSGIEVALLLRSESPNLPVLLTSGCPLDFWSDRNTADLGRLGSGSVVVVDKPFQLHVLANAVRSLIAAPRSEGRKTA
jgi:CheY-like chemotaxis protein